MMMQINESADFVTASFPKENSKLTVVIAEDFKKDLRQIIDEARNIVILDFYPCKKPASTFKTLQH